MTALSARVRLSGEAWYVFINTHNSGFIGMCSTSIYWQSRNKCFFSWENYRHRSYRWLRQKLKSFLRIERWEPQTRSGKLFLGKARIANAYVAAQPGTNFLVLYTACDFVERNNAKQWMISHTDLDRDTAVRTDVRNNRYTGNSALCPDYERDAFLQQHTLD